MRGKSKISVYLRNKNINPSGYYRIFQYTNKMKEYSFVYREGASDKIFSKHMNNGNRLNYICSIFISSIVSLIKDNISIPKVIIINREVCPKRITMIQKWLLKRILSKAYVIWDYDDDILQYKEISFAEWNLLKKYSKKIICLNEYHKKIILKDCEYKTIILPTTDGDYQYSEKDLEERKFSYNNKIDLVWVGTSSNLKNLDTINEQLNKATKILEKFGKQLTLTCVCNQPFINNASEFTVNNILWSKENAINSIRKAHIGIMPLIDNIGNRGKGGFKIIQYMSAALPVIVSPVGMNKEIVDNQNGRRCEFEEWANAIVAIGTQIELWESMSNNSLARCEKSFSYNKSLSLWRRIIREAMTAQCISV